MTELAKEIVERSVTVSGVQAKLSLSLLVDTKRKAYTRKLQIEEAFNQLPLPEQGSNRGYSPSQLLLHFWIGIWCGASCFEHLEVTRQDEVIKELFRWKRMAGSKAFQRYFSKFSHSINQEAFNQLYQLMPGNG